MKEVEKEKERDQKVRERELRERSKDSDQRKWGVQEERKEDGGLKKILEEDVQPKNQVDD